jgi:hypothetical protein
MVSAINPRTGAVDTRSYEATIMGNKLSINRGMGSETYIILSKNGGASKRTTPPKPKTPPTTQACPSQVGKAKELFGGSDINLYNESDVDQTTPIMSQICINNITPISDNKSELTSMGGKFAVISGKNGFVLETDEMDNGKQVKFYFECGANSLVNEDLVKLAIGMNKLSGVDADMPENLRQENVIAALSKLCSTGKSNLVPKVQNNKFASTGSQLGANNV